MTHYIKWFLLSSAVVCMSVFTSKVGAATYVMTELEGTALDTPTTLTTVTWDNTDTRYPNDDDQTVVNIGFTFRFAATDYTQVRIMTNGVLQFGAGTRMHRDYRNENLDTDEGDNIILVYWDDLVDDAQGSVTYGSMGTAPNRRFVVTWNNVRAYSNRNNRYDFQVVLYENGDIRYRYDNNTANGASATIGVEVDDTDFTLYSYNNTSVRTDFDLLFKNSLLSLPTPVINWQFDEEEWTGASGEVFDSSGNGLNGTASGGLTTDNASPAISGSVGTCRYGDFDGVDDLVQIPDTASLDLATAFTIGVWINIDSIPSSGLKSILSKDENFEFHVNTSGRIFWWWQDSAGTRTLTSSTSVTAGQWHHVVIRFQAGQQDIFIDGVNRGTASNSRVPRTNSDPFQIGGDQGISSRVFNGSIDEINVFDTALSDLQVVTLLNDTHPCSSQSACGASFPDGASSHSGGDIDFGYNARLFFSPDNELEFNNVTLNGGSTVSSCVTAECTASNNSAPTLSLPTFPSTSFSTDLTVSTGGTDTLGDLGTNEYDDVRARSNSTLNVSAAFGSYYMDTLRLDSGSTLNLLAGDYWIRSLTLSDSSTITVSGGTARFFVENDISIASNSLINSPALDSAGDSSELLLVGYGDVRFRSNSTTSAIVYSNGNARLDSPSYVFGAITADDTELNSNAQIRYQTTGVTKLDFGSLCDTSCALGSFDISQPTYAIACPSTRAEIDVIALCADGTTTKTDYTGTVALSGPATSTYFDAATNGNTLTGYTFLAGDLGVKTFYLYFNNENSNVQTTVTDSSASVSSTATTGTDFRASGFVLSDQVSSACATGFDYTVTAFGQNENASGEQCEVLTGFSGAKDLDVWYTVDYTNVNGTAADSDSTGISINGVVYTDQVNTVEDNVTTTFTGGIGTLSVNYQESGNVTLNIEHDTVPYDGSVGSLSALAASDSFVSYPSIFAITATGAAALNNTTDTGGTTHAAGAAFDLTITAQCSDGDTSEHYIPRTDSAVEASLERTGPTSGASQNGSLEIHSGVTATAVVSPSFTSINLPASTFSSGVMNYSGATYDEVGLINLSIRDSNYYGVTNFGASSLDIGRFVPDHFLVESISNGTFANACDSNSADFTYNGQPFTYDSAAEPSFRITPRSATNQTTNNYLDGFRKLTSATMIHKNGSSTWSTGTVTIADASGLNVDASFQSGTLADNNASFNYTMSSSDTFTFARVPAAEVSPFNADFQLVISDINDGEASGVISGASTSYSFKPTGTISLYYGRLNIENAFGPETEALPQDVTTQYWNGSQFVENADDDCTQIGTSMITTSPLPGGLGHTSIPVSSGTSDLTFDATFTDGDGNFSYSAPGAGERGTIDITFDISTLPWLQFDWDGNGTDEDPPQKTATFGQYRGHDRVIYWREITF